MSKRNRQRDTLLAHLREFGSITQEEARNEYGIARLASRVNDLRKAGIPIRTVVEIGRNRHGEPVHYARYTLQGGI